MMRIWTLAKSALKRCERGPVMRSAAVSESTDVRTEDNDERSTQSDEAKKLEGREVGQSSAEWASCQQVRSQEYAQRMS